MKNYLISFTNIVQIQNGCCELRRYTKDMQRLLDKTGRTTVGMDYECAILKRARLPIGYEEDIWKFREQEKQGQLDLTTAPLEYLAERAAFFMLKYQQHREENETTALSEAHKAKLNSLVSAYLSEADINWVQDNLNYPPEEFRERIISSLVPGFTNYAKAQGFEINEQEAREQAALAFNRLREAVEFLEANGRDTEKTYHSVQLT